MKKIFLGFTVALVTLVACDNKTGYVTTTATNLNTTETKLVGIWHVQTETDSQLYYINNVLSTDSTQTFAVSYTGYDSAYTDLSDTAFTSYYEARNLLCTDASGLAIGQTITPTNTPTGGATYWYYNDTTNKLVVGTYQYDVYTLSDSSLVLHNSTTDSNITNIRYYYFKK
jgi:hypothetical protein